MTHTTLPNAQQARQATCDEERTSGCIALTCVYVEKVRPLVAVPKYFTSMSGVSFSSSSN